jgi:hypothetical protein
MKEHLCIHMIPSCNLHYSHFIFAIHLYFIHFQEHFQKEEEEKKEFSSSKDKVKITP